MFRSRRDELTQALAQIKDLVDHIDRRVERIETVTLVREPATPVAADAYEGLRKQVVGAVSARMTHLSQLAQWEQALRQQGGPEALQYLLDQWFEQAGLRRVTDVRHPDSERYFEDIGGGGSGPVEVITPAYVDGVTGRVVRQGRVRRKSRSHALPEGELA